MKNLFFIPLLTFSAVSPAFANTLLSDGHAINGVEKSPTVGADRVLIFDSAGSYGVKWSTLTDLYWDHGQGDGLLDDDHTQYFHLTGRSGGQTAYGGTGPAEDIIFQTTSDPTKGSFLFGQTMEVEDEAQEVKIFGDTYWDGNGYGLPYGNIYGYEVADTITITSSGIANKVQIDSFNSNGPANLTTVDHTSDDITISKDGVYSIKWNSNIDSVDATSATFGIGVYKNGGTTLIENTHAHTDMAGGSGELKSVGNPAGLAGLVSGETVELWVWNITGTEDIEVDDVSLTIAMVGGYEAPAPVSTTDQGLYRNYVPSTGLGAVNY